VNPLLCYGLKVEEQENAGFPEFYFEMPVVKMLFFN
jgi:hypothetical protein